MLEETENVDLFLSEPFPSYIQMLRRKYLEFGGMQTSVHADTQLYECGRQGMDTILMPPVQTQVMVPESKDKEASGVQNGDQPSLFSSCRLS